MPSLSSTLFLLISFVSLSFSQFTPLSKNVGACSNSVQCPIAAPCCSEFGFCGTGHFCMGGCNPLGSYSPPACLPQPVCQSGNYTFSNSSRIVNATLFNGDASAADFTLDSGLALFTGAGELVLPLTQFGSTAAGSRISTTRAILYGTVVTRMKTSQYAGIVSTFITMSGIKDEIDWEFPGSNTSSGQTNYYSDGLTANYTHGGTAALSNSYANYHDYGLIWGPDQLQWTVDTNVVRTLTRASTLDNATGIYHYPNSPSRVQISVWPAGIPAQPLGTQQWAGGLINWNETDYRSTGYFYALVDHVSITCDKSAAGGVSYVYSATNSSITGEPTVLLSNQSTQIFSQAATGLAMTAGKTTASSSNATFGLINSSPISISFNFQSMAALILVAGGALLL